VTTQRQSDRGKNTVLDSEAEDTEEGQNEDEYYLF